MHIMKKFIIPTVQQAVCLALLTFGLNGCSKKVDTNIPVNNTARISFYNASYALTGECNGRNPYGNFILVDSHDTGYTTLLDFSEAKYPYFHNTNSFGPAFPLSYNADQWLNYMRLSTGDHYLLLLDTSRVILDSTYVKLGPESTTTIFYGDYFGVYKTLTLSDPFVPIDGKIGLRIVNLSPTNGSVFVTLNKTIPQELPAQTQYGDHTGFISINIPGSDTLKVKVYAPGDTTTVLARTSVITMPGHAYTLLISGYNNNSPASYVDPRTQKTVGITPNFSVTPIKNF